MPNNHMHSDNKKRRSSFLVALLFPAGDVKRYPPSLGKRRAQTWADNGAANSVGYPSRSDLPPRPQAGLVARSKLTSTVTIARAAAGSSSAYPVIHARGGTGERSSPARAVGLSRRSHSVQRYAAPQGRTFWITTPPHPPILRIQPRLRVRRDRFADGFIARADNYTLNPAGWSDQVPR